MSDDLGSCWICASEETVYMDVIGCAWCEDCFDKEYR